MKDQVLRIEYFTLTTDDRPGIGADLGRRLAKENVNLLGLLEVPHQPGKVQIDLIPENPEAFSRAARKLGIQLSEPRLAFLTQGSDRPGAVAETLERLGNSQINVRSVMAISGGGNRYGAILFVEPSLIEEATRALGANVATHHI
jgi:predicted amino acid-binding ACT domain protein